MISVKYHHGFELPISINISEHDAHILYALLMLVQQNKNHFVEKQNKIANELANKINEVIPY